MKKNKLVFDKYQTILKITLAAIFSGLCFAVMFFPKITIPAAVGTPFIHLGNLIVILVALLFGGPIGGISGAIGMGLFDIIDGYGIWTIKTVVLKFGIGLFTGLIYGHFNKKYSPRITLYSIIMGSIFFIFGLTTMIIAIANHSIITIGSKEIALSWPLYVFSMVIGLVCIIVPLISRKKNYDYKIALYASTVGIAFNIVGEFIGKIIKAALQGNGFKVSVVMGVASIPATIMNGVIALVIVMLVYPVLNKAVSQISILNKKEKTDEVTEQKETIE